MSLQKLQLMASHCIVHTGIVNQFIAAMIILSEGMLGQSGNKFGETNLGIPLNLIVFF